MEMQSKFARDMMAQKLMSENKDNPFNSRFFQPSDAMAAPQSQGFRNLMSKMEQRDKQGVSGDVPYAVGAMASGFTPGAGVSDVLGFAPDPFNPGQTLPSFSENVDRGNYLDAGLQTVGAGGDVMLAASPFAPYLLLPAAGMKLTSQLGKALRSGSKATKATDDIKPGQTLYRYEKSEYSSPDTGAIFYSPDKSYAELYNSDSSLLKTSKVPDKFLDIRTNSGQEKAINWINKEIDKLEKAEIPRTSQDIKLAKQFLKQKDAQGISSSLANLNIIYSKQLNTKINPGLAEKKMMGSLDFDAMTIREAGREGEDFSIAFRKNPSTKTVDETKDNVVELDFQKKKIEAQRNQMVSKVKGIVEDMPNTMNLPYEIGQKLHSEGKLPLPIGTSLLPLGRKGYPDEVHKIIGYKGDIYNPDLYGYEIQAPNGDIFFQAISNPKLGLREQKVDKVGSFTAALGPEGVAKMRFVPPSRSVKPGNT